MISTATYLQKKKEKKRKDKLCSLLGVATYEVKVSKRVRDDKFSECNRAKEIYLLID